MSHAPPNAPPPTVNANVGFPNPLAGFAGLNIPAGFPPVVPAAQAQNVSNEGIQRAAQVASAAAAQAAAAGAPPQMQIIQALMTTMHQDPAAATAMIQRMQQMMLPVAAHHGVSPQQLAHAQGALLQQMFHNATQAGAASAAMRAEAVGYAADLTEAKLVADEDRDAAKAASMRAAQAKADALRDRDMLAEALRSAEAVEDRLRASEAALGARCLQEKNERHKADMKLEEVTKGADDALTVAATQQRERDLKLRELDALSARLAQELETRVGELVASKQSLQELEAAFRGAGWNVIKVIWGEDWDQFLDGDHGDLFLQRLEEVVDGDLLKYVVEGGAYIREHFYGKYQNYYTI